MKKKIVLFTGAGMSVPMGLPAAAGFKATITKCDPTLLSYFKGHLDKDADDIEKLLYTVDEFLNGSDFFKYIISRNLHVSYFQNVSTMMNGYLSNAELFERQIKNDIFRILQNFDIGIATSIYVNLLESFRQYWKEFSLSIFTTNYDLILEEIINESEELEQLGYEIFNFGFKHKKGKMTFDPTEDFNWATDIIEYNKLHGSLDWTKDIAGRVVKTGANTLPANPDDMPLLYPGYKGTPTAEPFISLHNKLYLRLCQCDEVYVIGFAFRDPYINSIFEFAMRANIDKPNFKIHCYNPSHLKDLPKESVIPHFITSFSKLFSYYKKGISDSDDPLGILSSS